MSDEISFRVQVRYADSPHDSSNRVLSKDELLKEKPWLSDLLDSLTCNEFFKIVVTRDLRQMEITNTT